MTPLAAWLKRENMSAMAFGKALGWPHPRDAYRYANGRVPDAERMVQIYEFTKGEITPDHFVLGHAA